MKSTTNKVSHPCIQERRITAVELEIGSRKEANGDLKKEDESLRSQLVAVQVQLGSINTLLKVLLAIFTIMAGCFTGILYLLFHLL